MNARGPTPTEGDWRTRLRNDEIARDLWQLLYRYRWRIGLATGFLLLAKVATVVVPLILKRIIDEFSRPEQLPVLPAYLLIGYALVRFSSTLFNELRDLLFSRVSQSTVAIYARKTFAHLHSLGPRFHSQRRIGGLLPDIDRGTAGIAFLLGAGLFTLVPILVEIGMVLAIMLAKYSGWFAGIIAFLFFAYSGFTLYFTARRTIHQRRVNRLDSEAKGKMADSLINADNIKYFTNESLEADRFTGIMAHWTDAAISNQQALFVLHVGQSAIIAVGLGAIMLLAGHEVWQHRMTVGDLVLINAYVLQVCLPLNALGFAYREVKDAWVNVERLFVLLREKPEIAQKPDQPALKIQAGEVVFDHVYFHYVPERPILFDISFRIPAGKTLAVVGGSGSGKSTLARLLLRFYDPIQGRILVDGQDIASVRVDSVRQVIGVVPQDTILFNESIAYNIGYGRNGATLEDIHNVARAAHIHEFIESLPEKYDTLVGERGVKLSGGERQRIAVARAMLKNPPILIFDEATSALDSSSENAIQRELNRLSTNRTTLIIAHRLSTVVGADEIMVLERGRIVERGTHAELLSLRGMYAQLWLLQQRQEKEKVAAEAQNL
ncbi:ATP-binding cassette, subfamily B, bacterial [Novimethylophilus kurashikiensis]|uniref:ATP-binding cassette, subfamily B, bacterial n=1 Tax=Novimethylophilus kurashikiensis TaxID=1825523 RepID=A0A2R5F4B8_9PROT|nr:ABC transporter ATP-binding protein/permease [Novimethylophilus kurashikiensis]GBG12598.1 ATP-binding cassette, subfamily B, bacterial [Novimethylophilus kurashikiensis]